METPGFFAEPNDASAAAAPPPWDPDDPLGMGGAFAAAQVDNSVAAQGSSPALQGAPAASPPLAPLASSAFPPAFTPSETPAFAPPAAYAPQSTSEPGPVALAPTGSAPVRSTVPGHAPAVSGSADAFSQAAADATALAPQSTGFLAGEPSPAVTSAAPRSADFPEIGEDPGYQQNRVGDAVVLTDLLMAVLDRGASDLHITAGARPTMRVNGTLAQMEDRPIMTPPVIQQMMYEILTQRQRERFEEELELDFAYAVPGRARFRVNLYRQREALGAAFRLIPFEIKPLEALGIPPAVSNFSMLPRGFVLVTGPTGSGKSTTLAGIIDQANRQRHDHIMTVEDPIEFLHQHKSCLVNQREVGDDTRSFANALKHVLRQDPDIILVGEMRDLETISVALTAAETGHLVFATLHTQDAAQTIDRVIDVFPPHQQQQVRVQLAGSLQGVVAQTLCKTVDGRSRIVATEVLFATPAIRNLIREGKTHQIYSALQAGARHGMHTMDQHLAELTKAGKISYETGVEKCHHVEDFNRLVGRG